ncbi:MAG: class I SAM-dependent methyltransferase [Planctomycetota bacterium]
MDTKELLKFYRSRPETLKAMDLMGPEGQMDSGGDKKLREVAGLIEIILRYVREFIPDQDLRVLEGSCGKSYLGFALCVLLEELEDREVKYCGVDSDPELIERCRKLSAKLGLSDAAFFACRTVEFDSSVDFNLATSLHACDTATDELIAKGIELDVRLILTVPCCQSQIRGQIKNGHPLTPMTDYGPARYRFANLLTDTLRGQFLNAAGYHVKLDEIGSPRLTPKNLCICARKVKRRSRSRRDLGYRKLREMFDVRPAIEKLCPGIIDGDAD